MRPSNSGQSSALGAAASLLPPAGGLGVRVLTGLVLCATLVVASALPGIEFAFGLTGSTASMVLSYIIPAAMFLKVGAGSGRMTD